MNSIIDQYESEKSTNQSNTKGRTVSVAELASQYALLNFEFDPEKEDTPMFNISRLKSLPPITSRLQHFAVGGEHLVFVAVNSTLTFLNWKDSSKPKEIDINKTLGFANKVNGVFLDPIGGHHILLSVTAVSNVNSSPASAASSDYLFYCNTSLSHLKLRPVEKMRNHNVTAVAWNRMTVTPQCTSPILLGTSKGLIFEIKLNAESDKLFQSSIDSYCKDVFDIGRGIPAASITGLEFFKFSNVVDKYFVIATTVNRLYQFIGSVSNVEDRPSLAQIFDDYLKIPEGFVELPNTASVSYSQVHFTKTEDETGRFSLVPKSFGWHVNKIGIVYRQIQSEWRKGMTEVCVLNSVLDYSPLEPAAITFLLTEFHFLLLYSDRIEIFSVLNKENCFVESHNTSHGKFLDLCKDVDDNVWVLAERAIYKCRFIKEDRFVWRIYLDMKKFSLAKEHCKTNINRLYKVMKKEAEYYFENGQYEESASLYSQLDGISFEEIALKFLLAGKVEALKLYLMKMLEKLKPYENAHITMITFWLFEIYEKQFADAKYGNYPLSEQKQLQRDFKTLLSLPQVQNCVGKNREVTYKLLNSHGDTENLIHVALMLRDYEKVVRQYLEEGRVNEAVNILKDESAPIQKDLISSFMTTFISMAPKDTVDVLIKLARNLEPCSILPSLIFPYDNEVQAAEVIRFLEYCTHSLHSHDQAIHNYLITLYAKYKPDRLMRYLASQGHDETEINYDIRYALKLCQEYGLTEACVQLSALLGLWESAVDLALSIDVELAKQTVPQLNSENAGLCKKLWLKIAQHVVQKSKDIKEAMKFVQQCDIVRIEDILPFFDDFDTIDHFRDAICTSIQEYNQNIEELKGEMDDATKSADEIRTDLSSFKCRYDTIQSSMQCTSCNIQLLIRPFYIFPCSHRFHIDCLVSELRPHLSEVNVKKVDTLQRQLAEMSQNPNVEDRNPASLNSRNLKDQFKSELDFILASECFFCGSIAIEQIDTPFIEDDEFERIRVDWE